MRLPLDKPSQGLRGHALSDPAIAALLAGEGPDAVRLETCELSRVRSSSGMLLRARAHRPAGTSSSPALRELALQAIGLSRLAGSIAHEVKNPLNAMALQLAVLGDKISTASPPLASACAGNLGSLKNQIGRINEVVRRYLDVADPAGSNGFDMAVLLADVAYLFAHESRRRRIAITCEASPGGDRCSADPTHAARLLLLLFWRAVAGTREGGRLTARCAPKDGSVAVALEHTRGVPDVAFAEVFEVVAAAAPEMEGTLEETVEGDTVRVLFALPKERPL